MAAIANITVKRYDGTTDIVWDALSGSPGDGQPAIYRMDTGTSSAVPYGMRATASFMQKWNGPRTARVGDLLFKVPNYAVNTQTGFYEARDTSLISVHTVLPQGIPPAVQKEALAWALNFCAHLTVRDQLATGFAPT